jgi:threonine/homoserine/homoserine lactone efflux protein
VVPNNITLTSSGIRISFLRLILHMFKIAFGFGAIYAMCAMGIRSLILAIPASQSALMVAGPEYLVYLVWQLRRIAFYRAVHGNQRPMIVLGVALFEFAGSKA